MTRTALFVSPHLDDVVFSCGGTLADLAGRGWRTCLATVFTATVLPVSGFALACQLDKGLPPEVDYMALRREEDRAAAAILGVDTLRWLDLPEAPHRGYHAAAALFADILPGDGIWAPTQHALRALIDELRPELVFAPQGLGGHVDHRQVIRAVAAVAPADILLWYRDSPYAIRNPAARPYVDGTTVTHAVAHTLDRKIEAACAYQSQIGFQFGGPAAAAEALAAFAARERGEKFMANGAETTLSQE